MTLKPIPNSKAAPPAHHPRAVPLHPETLFLAQVHKVEDRGTALSALSCQTCQQLMLHLWDALVPWVNAHGSLPPGQAVTQYAWDLCAHEVRLWPRGRGCWSRGEVMLVVRFMPKVDPDSVTSKPCTPERRPAYTRRSQMNARLTTPLPPPRARSRSAC